MTNSRDTIQQSKAQRPLFVGVDVGGTNTKIGVVDDLGRTLAYMSVPTEEQNGPADAVRRISETITALADEHAIAMGDVAGIGLGSPGSMNIRDGLILEPPNMPHWRDFPIRDRLAEASGKPVAFANDANAAAFGEFWVGGGRHYDSMIMLTLGTGVGGGIIVDGRLINGVNSFGSECGHIVIDHRDDARICAWGGGQGQLEAYASASAVALRAKEALVAGATSSLSARMAKGEELTALMLSEEAEGGDELSLRIILETAKFLGIGIVTLVHTIDPGAVILGGAMDFGGIESPIGRQFLETARDEFKRRAYHVVRDTTSIDFAILGGDAGYIGAAGIARASFQEA